MVTGLWRSGRWYERPEPSSSWTVAGSSDCDTLSHLEVKPSEVADWRAWFAAAAANVARERAREVREPSEATTPACDPCEGEGGAFAGRQTMVWTEADGWRLADAGADLGAPRPSSFLDTVGISRQVLGITRHSPAEVATLESLAAVTAAYRAAMAERHEVRARDALGRALAARTSTDRRAALSSHRWHRDRAEGWRRRWATAAECGTRSAWVATCAGCDAKREPVTLRCGLPRECPRCRGAELGRRVERIERQLEAGRRLRVRECARRGPTIARPLGAWDWRFVSLTIPPGAGVHADARDVRRAFADLVRRIDAWLRIEGGEKSGCMVLSSVEGTPGESRHGHIHLHALFLSPYIPHALIRRIWGEELAKRHSRRAIPYEVPSDAIEGVTHAPTARLITYTRRGRHGRPLDAVPFPIVDIRAADAGSIRELAKYAVKGIYQPSAEQVSKWADVYCSLASVRLFASSRRLAAEVAPVEPAKSMHCEACGLVGDWTHDVKKQRGPPEGARAYSCRAIIGLA